MTPRSPLFHKLLSALTLAALSLPTVPTSGKEPEPVQSTQTAGSEVDWLTGNGVTLGGILSPHFHFDAIYGGSTADPERLITGHHDPDREGWTISNIEFGASLRAGEHFEAFGAYAAKIDLDDKWQGEFEEWFGKLKDLPGSLELRGGKYYNRFGIQNTYHPHGFDWADQYLVNGRFLGEDNLATVGGEVTWKLPVGWTSLVSVSFGVAPEREEEDHAEPEVEPIFEAEGATFDDIITAANWTNLMDWNDFHQFRAGLSGAWGDNLWGLTTQIYGSHFEYQWRENGYESGGNYFRWRTEAMLRNFDAISGHLPGEEPEEEEGEDEHERERNGSLNEIGVYTSLAYGFDNGIELALRGEFVEGIASAGMDKRFRISPGVNWFANNARTLKLRLQYNYDHSSDFGDEHSIWAQVGLAWGGAEVR
jgi:hypothetical protein